MNMELNMLRYAIKDSFTIQVAIDGWMNKENVVHTHIGILFSHQKEDLAFFNMDGP